MPGLEPGIHAFLFWLQDVDGRVKRAAMTSRMRLPGSLLARAIHIRLRQGFGGQAGR